MICRSAEQHTYHTHILDPGNDITNQLCLQAATQRPAALHTCKKRQESLRSGRRMLRDAEAPAWMQCALVVAQVAAEAAEGVKAGK